MRLRTRLAVLFFALLIVPIFAMSVVALDYSIGTMIEDLCRSADLLAQQVLEQMQLELATGAKDPYVMLKEGAPLRRLLDSTQAYGQGIVSASIIATDGRVIASAHGEGEDAVGPVGPARRPLARLRSQASRWLPFYAFSEFWTADVYELRRPVLADGHPLAVISVGVTTALIADRMRRVLLMVFITALADIGVAWLMLSLITSRVFNHLSRILHSFEELAEGSTTEVELKPEGEAELDALTEKFNVLSRRVRTERAQLATRDHLFDIVRSMQDAILMVDPTGAILFANPRAREILTPEAENIEGGSLSSLLGENHRLVTLASSTMQTGAEAHDVTMEFSKGGSFLVTLFKLGRGRTPAGLLVLLRDLQPVIELETALDYSNRLARLGALLSGVAHQLRSPLHGMNLRLELLSNDDGEEGKQRHIERLRQEIERLDQSVEALLRFMRPEDIKTSSFDANEMLRQLGASVHHDHVRIEYLLTEQLPPVSGDRAMISEALTNVITNAVQAMPQGGVLTLRSLPTDGGVEVQVADTGVGIEQTKLDQVFNLYYTTKPHGSGLGLSLALRAIELNRGTIEIESKISEGTTCKIRMPGARSETPNDATTNAA